MEGKISKYFKYRRINKYLKSKDESKYSYLDNIFKYYVDGDLEKLFKCYYFSKIELFPELNKKGNLLQIYFYYFNLVVFIQFDDMKIDYTIYLEDMSPSYADDYFVSLEYDKDFNIENFFEKFYKMLQKDPRLEINKKNY